ncbi:MAG: RDD family protein [Desulfurococcales archaeon]|nr:RDD family protein [Desulfurococcales archaeon]
MARSRIEENEELCSIMCNKIRLTIAEVLYNRVEVPYSELATLVGISESLLNHHLKKMKGLIDKGRNGYKLTWRGRELYRTIQTLTTKTDSSQTITHSTSAKRALAFIIDILVFFISTGAILDPHMLAGIKEIITGIMSLDTSTLISGVARLLDRSIIGYSNVFFATFIFLTLLEAHNGQTLGKHLLHLRVVRRDGSKLTLVESGIRNAGKIFLLPIDVVLGLILYRKQGYIKLTDYIVEAVILDESNTKSHKIN